MADQFVDKIVLGHNAFFGVDHLSAARGMQRAAHFAKPERILEIIDFAMSHDVCGMMMSTHARAGEVLNLMKGQPKYQTELRLYPLLPYVQKYVVAANQKGILNVLMDSMSGASGSEKLKMIWNGAKGVLGKDLRSILTNLIQIELLPFRGFKMQYVFLHDAFTDLALAFNLKNIFEFYIEEIRTKFGCEAAFTTKNLPRYLDKCKEWNLGTPLVMTHVNKVGFSMNPSRELTETALKNFPARVMAMSTLASGHLAPDEAFEYLGGVPGIESVVVGASSRDHCVETFSAIRRHVFLENNQKKVVGQR